MAQNKHKLNIKINGIDLQILTENDPMQAKKVADYLDKSINTVKSEAPNITNINAILLASLNLSEEIFSLKEKIEKLASYDQPIKPLSHETDNDEVKELQAEIETYKLNAKRQNKKITQVEEDRDILKLELEEEKQSKNSIKLEYDSLKKKYEELQNKHMENQIEFLKVKKTLIDFKE